MGVWTPTRHARWIIPLVTIPFIIIGGMLAWMAYSMPMDVPSESLGITRKTELYIMAIIFILSPIITLGWIFLWVGRGQKRAAWLIENGILGTAKILGYEETGQTVNDTPKIELQLEIKTPQHAAYKLTHDEYISILYLSKLAIGKEVPVLVDPQNPENIFLDLEQLKYE